MVAKMDATMLRLDFIGAMVVAIAHGSKLKLSLDELVPHGIDPHGVCLRDISDPTEKCDQSGAEGGMSYWRLGFTNSC